MRKISRPSGWLVLAAIVAGLLLLLAGLPALGWMTDYGLMRLYESRGGWAVRAVLLGGAALVLAWALVARRSS